MVKSFSLFFFAMTVALFPIQTLAQSKTDVLILGDSQISFGAGEAYLSFFDNIARNCAGTGLKKRGLAKLGARRTLAVGVRSTSLHSWVARGGAAKGTICDVDKKFGVNAGAYGINGDQERKFIQIGKERGFQYCQQNQSAFETLFQSAENQPKLLVLNFLGNAEKRWAGSQQKADADLSQTLKQIPKDVPCVILTTAPVFSKKTNDARMTAQARLVKASENVGNRCEIVQGFTPQTRNAIEGKSQFFRRNKSGRVVDPHHPNIRATSRFVKLVTPKLCDAIAQVLK